MKKFDPFELDGTDYAKLVAMSEDFSSKVREEKAHKASLAMMDAHPFFEDGVVRAALKYLTEFQDTLRKERYPHGGCNVDAYQEFNEGWNLRPEVVVKIIIDYCRAHPQLLG